MPNILRKGYDRSILVSVRSVINASFSVFYDKDTLVEYARSPNAAKSVEKVSPFLSFPFEVFKERREGMKRNPKKQ